MEITNEIKAKVFAQYLGHKVELDSGGSKLIKTLCAVGGINDDAEYIELRVGNFSHAVFIKGNSFKLILKPLSDITNEDTIEVVKLQQEFKQQKGIKVDFHIDDKNNGCLDCIIQWDGYTHDYYQPVYSPTYQYLQSKGYDLPQYLLGGKTLQEYGLAVYEK